jgi:hypothetical protein
MADGTQVHEPTHDGVLKAEKEHLGLDPDKPTELFGLALSGGGIRSASFALGLLQALYGFGAFEKFHYLSTVSGGGYIGSALTYFRNVFFSDPSKPKEYVRDWFPFGYLKGADVRAIGARTEKPADPANLRAYEIVSFLRQHASFLTPSRKLDRPALTAGVLRGLIGCVLPYMMILVGIFGVALAAGLFDYQIGMAGIETVVALDSLADQKVAFYFALLPIGLAATMLALTLLSSLWHVLSSSWASMGVESEAMALARYRSGIDCMSFVGFLLLLSGALILLALLPWLHDYLSSLADHGGELPTTFGALFAALAGAAAQIAKLRAIVGGTSSAPSLTKNLLMVVAGIAFVFGVILLAYILGFDLALAARGPVATTLAGWGLLLSTQAITVLVPLLLLLVGLALAFFINVNHASQHRIYRDRLMEVFCAEEQALKQGQWCAAEKAQGQDGWLMNMVKVKKPYHLISTALITTDSNDRKYRGRGGDNFLLSPLYCGSDATGWAKTGTCMPAISIATAAAVSGAALNAHAGPHGSGGLRNKAYAALLSFLGLNLGYWARNPAKFKDPANPPHFKMPNLIWPGLHNISGRSLNEEGKYVQLSDGGHFENLAIYELIRRKVKFLWVSDAGQDTKFSFEDLSSAIERVRVDFGVNIRFYDEDFDLTHLLPNSAITDSPASKNFADEYNLARRGYAIGTVEYPDDKPDDHGVIVYVKSTLTRFLPGDIYGYKARNADFPHQTTLDQFFDEEQFEAYRELGYRLTARLFRDIEDIGKTGSRMPPALAKVAEKVEFSPS